MAKRILWIVLLIFLAAAFGRLWRLHDAPPGLQHDELFKAQEGQAIIENGDIRVFYPSNQGHEGGYVWLLGIAYLLFGANLIMIKMPAFWCGMLTLALLFRFVKDLFTVRVAVLAMGLAAVSFWMISTNRVGLRANSLPLVTLAVLWGLWRVCHTEKRRWWLAIFTGFLLGFAIYTYTAAFVLYIAFGVFLLALAIFDRPKLKRHFPELALITLLGAVLTLPMVNYRLNDPSGRDRVSTINLPYTELKKGNFDPVLENARLLLGMPIFRGDPEWRYNVAGRPLFIFPVGLLVYAGFLILLWRIRREPLYGMLLALAIFGLIPSLLTTSAPSFLRSIITLPSIIIFAALGIDQIGTISRRFLQNGVWGIGIVVILLTGVADWHTYFDTWIHNDAVQTVYRDDLEQLAAYLREHPQEDLVMVSTTEPAILDRSIYAFMNPPHDTDVMWFDGITTIVLSPESRLLFVSPLAPISPAHAEWLTPQMGTQTLSPVLRQDGGIAFDVYRLSSSGTAVQDRLQSVSQWQLYLGTASPAAISEWGIPYDYPVNFGNLLQLVGVEMPVTIVPAKDNGVDNGLQLQLYLQPLTHDIGTPLSIFVHFVSTANTTVMGRDFLGAPPTSWNPTLTFIQDNYVGSYDIPPGRYFVEMGLYDTVTQIRVPILDETGQVQGDHIFLGQIEAVSSE